MKILVNFTFSNITSLATSSLLFITKIKCELSLMAGSESGPEQDPLRHSEPLLFVEYLNLPGTSSAPCSW